MCWRADWHGPCWIEAISIWEVFHVRTLTPQRARHPGGARLGRDFDPDLVLGRFRANRTEGFAQCTLRRLQCRVLPGRGERVLRGGGRKADLRPLRRIR